MTLAELGDSDSILRAGNPDKQSVTIFYDSKVGTHQEFLDILSLKQIFARLGAFEVVLVDVGSTNAENTAKASAVLSELSIDLEKVRRKTDPSIFVHVNDTLHKVKPDALKEPAEFRALVDRVSKVRLAASVKDLVTALKENNRSLDSLTIVYCAEVDPEKNELE